MSSGATKRRRKGSTGPRSSHLLELLNAVFRPPRPCVAVEAQGREHEVGAPGRKVVRIDVLQLGELEPLDKRGGRRQTRVELLARFFRAASAEELENLATEYPLMANLVEALTDVSKSSDLRETLRATRAAAIFAEQAELRKTERAHAAGKAEGKLEAKREIAATLLAHGLTREAVEAAVTTQLADLGL